MSAPFVPYAGVVRGEAVQPRFYCYGDEDHPLRDVGALHACVRLRLQIEPGS